MAENKKLRREFEARGLNVATQNILEEASIIQTELENISKNTNLKIQAVIREFNAEKNPLFNKRQELLSTIPFFWSTAFVNHPKLKLLLNNPIEDCFRYLKLLRVIEIDPRCFNIIFEFNDNPYFYNNKLVKELIHEGNEHIMKGAQIDWKENMNLCSESVKREDRKRCLPLENFFDWLISSSQHDIICDVIRDDLWDDPMKFFFMTREFPQETASEGSEDCQDCDDLLEDKETSSDENSSILSENENKE